MNWKRVLDTNRLIAHWHRCRGKRALDTLSPRDVEAWARRQIELERTDAIVTPVVIEFLCGAMGQHELALSRAFLAQFDVIDRGNITSSDWENAQRIAAWVRGNSKPRDFADCLIRAIADRLNDEVLTSDRDFNRRS